jgi:hypothetical protein
MTTKFNTKLLFPSLLIRVTRGVCLDIGGLHREYGFREITRRACLCFLLFNPIAIYAQTSVRDAVILKHGEAQVGKLIESVDDSVRIQLDNGTILTYHRSQIVAQTKENVLPNYVPQEERVEPRLFVLSSFSKGMNTLYGYGFGGRIIKTFSSNVSIGASVDYYMGTVRQFAFLTTILVLHPEYPTIIQRVSTISEKSSALIILATIGKDLQWRSLMIRPSFGLGFAQLKSNVSYLLGPVANVGDYPEAGTKNHIYFSLGLTFIFSVTPSLTLQPEVRYYQSLIDIIGSFEDRGRQSTFVEGKNSGLSLILSLSMRID